MQMLSHLFESKGCNSVEASQPSPYSSQAPHSSVSANSIPVSPVASLFSTKGHHSVSSLISSGMGNSMEGSGSLRTQLRDVKEEPLDRSSKEIEDDYFEHFDQFPSEYYPDEAYSSTLDSDGYDLTDRPLDILHSPKRRRSEGLSTRGLSRIGTRISTMSAKWKSKHSSDAPYVDETLGDDLRSRANSASSTLNPISKIDSQIPQSPARSFLEPRMSDISVAPIDIEKANRQSMEEDLLPQASTPLLPPLLSGYSTLATNSPVHSPLQSPSVADVTDDSNFTASTGACVAIYPSPPLSTKPSIASMHRARANTVRTISGDGAPPFVLTDPGDKWAHKLGHANFTIQPEPYVLDQCDVESFRQFRLDWDLARCHYAKHLVRTGEHYGVTSKIYQLTEEKWESIEREWKRNHEAIVSNLGGLEGAVLGLTTSNIHPCDAIKIPRLHDNDKFPELGDEEIVGPMSVAPAMYAPTGTKSEKKRSFLKFFHDLVARSHSSRVATTRA